MEGDTAGCTFVKIFATPWWRSTSVCYSRQYEFSVDEADGPQVADSDDVSGTSHTSDGTGPRDRRHRRPQHDYALEDINDVAVKPEQREIDGRAVIVP